MGSERWLARVWNDEGAGVLWERLYGQDAVGYFASHFSPGVHTAKTRYDDEDALWAAYRKEAAQFRGAPYPGVTVPPPPPPPMDREAVLRRLERWLFAGPPRRTVGIEPTIAGVAVHLRAVHEFDEEKRWGSAMEPTFIDALERALDMIGAP